MSEIKLNGIWKATPLEIEDNRFGITKESVYDVHIPGDLHSALIDEKIIPNPYYGKNELDILFLSRSEWLIEREFNWKKTEKRVFLRLEKLDTVASLYINDEKVRDYDNIHRIYYEDITSFVVDGKNKIGFVFHSAEKEAERRNKSLEYPIPCSLYPNGSPHRNLVRKTQCSAGWDWGPCIMALGIYVTPVIIETDSLLLKDFAVTTKRMKNKWKVDYEIYLLGVESNDESVVTINLLGEDHYFTIKNWKGSFTLRKTITVDGKDISIWWPNGMGKQTLYNTEVTVAGQKKRRKIGFRTLEVKNAVKYGGKELTVSVNGRDVFLKGSNWIPLDALPSRMTKERYDSILKDARDANMNAVRVWGGGWYEKEEFYDACDRYGLLIWQDMMFACSTYPSEKWFLSSVREEIIDQIRRLKSRASIALWCGNNEDLGALGWYEETIKNRERYLKDYELLNNETVGKTVEKEDPSRTFWPSSPCAGPGDYSDNWHNDGNGDMHFWSVWHEGKPFEFYHTVKPRFCSEFGYQSFPSPYTVSTFCPEEERDIYSPVMLHHQKNEKGNEIISSEFERAFKKPSTFTDALYLSLVQQALAIETAVTYWRSLMPYCMGTLIWQLNDVWPVSSWSSIEYSGRWKPLHYAVKHFYAPLCPLLYKDDDIIHVKVVNDTDKEKKVNIRVRVITFSGETIDDKNYSYSIAPATVINICEVKKERDDTFVLVSLEKRGIKEERFLFFNPVGNEKVEKSRIAIKSVERKGERVMITLSSLKPSLFVLLDTKTINGHFSDNYTSLLNGEDKTIVFTPEEKGLPLERIKEDLVLWDISRIF